MIVHQRSNKRGIRIILSLCWVLFVCALFNYYASEVDDFNAKVRVFVKTGELDTRQFDSNGIPLSKSPRIGEFVSPFYVVHYGLIYSDTLNVQGEHWRSDPSIAHWGNGRENLAVEQRVEYFRKSADWIVDNLEFHNGHAHLFYHFDWPYKGYPSGILKGPWWSGLTDGYAIVLMLRAADYFGDSKYIETARKLYSSVVTSVQEGGSLTNLNSCPWIEEYVDPRFLHQEMSFVFNGMVYATYGIEYFEKYANVENKKGIASALYSCIEQNLNLFDLGAWSYYDAIGNAANIKYHKVNFAIVLDMLGREKIQKESVLPYVQSWRLGFDNLGLYYILKGPRSIAYYHFVVTFLFVVMLPFMLSFMRRRLWSADQD